MARRLERKMKEKRDGRGRDGTRTRTDNTGKYSKNKTDGVERGEGAL